VAELAKSEPMEVTIPSFTGLSYTHVEDEIATLSSEGELHNDSP
jgi:hypothetical protein